MEKKKTMNDMYGDKSKNHIACEECGMCITCGDCKNYGCGKGFKLNKINKR